MVRNIDLVEALIFYGEEAFIQASNEGGAGNQLQRFSLLGGVKNIFEECGRDDTAVVAILRNNPTTEQITSYLNTQYPIVQIKPETESPPNPHDLWEAIHSFVIHPKGFGGSSGFGTKAADPERPPMPNRCVVLCCTENQCRAARYAGMRVICLNDNPLADAVLDLDWSLIGMDDIATPGSFWLNPPHPKDDDGNRVDVEAVIERYQQYMHQKGEGAVDDANGYSVPRVRTAVDLPTNSKESSDAELAKILADMDPI